MATALYTTVFPNAIPFLSEFVRSIDAQSDRDFDLFVGLDRLAVEDVEPLFDCRNRPQWVAAHPDDSPASIRQRSWEQILLAYDRVVLVDADDVLGLDRVAQAKRGLEVADVYACALDLIAEDGTRYGQAFRAGYVRDWMTFLTSRNVFGLSNTAYRSDILKACLPLDAATGVIDWHLVSRALHAGAKLVFDDDCHMRYRLYAASMARVLPPFDVGYVRYATALVLAHHDVLRPYIETDPRQSRLLDDRRGDVALFSHLPDSQLEHYVKYLNDRRGVVHLWWECVAREELRWLWGS